MSDIKLFKLSNGEEIVARRKEETQTSFVLLESPMTLKMLPSDKVGGMGLALFPWLVGAPEDVTITLSLDHIVVETVPKEAIEKSYLSKLTGLTL